MPQPVPLATREEEDRRAWVTAHHEVVRLVKDCFGDRFSNNEIFDRLKISRRTGYRALGNDERIGKAPGRKPKITEQTIQDMIDYIESGGCNDVGNVWKHLATKFAPDCNPKTVQDAIKKSGFRNHRDTVKLEPLLAQHIPDQPLDDDVQGQQLQQLEQAQQQQTQTQQQQQQQTQQQQQQQAQAQQQQQQQAANQQLQQDTANAIDPLFHQPPLPEQLRSSIDNSPEGHIRYVLHDICQRIPDASNITMSYLCPYLSQSGPLGVSMGSTSMNTPLDPSPISPADGGPSGKRRTAICRRCGQHFDRAENTMENRSCLYHKGSPQKISPEDVGSIERSPEAFIWSCCGGNGKVPGCSRAMHTTKKKRTYGKKRSASAAGLDETTTGDADEDNDHDHQQGVDVARALNGANPINGLNGLHAGAVDSAMADTALGASHMPDPNIDSQLQDLNGLTGATAHHHHHHHHHPHHMPMMQLLPADMQGVSAALGHAGIGTLPPEVQSQLATG